MLSDAEEIRYRKVLIERLVFGFTCHQYNLLYEGKWKFSFRETKDRRFQAYAVTEVWKYNYGSSRSWRHRITLTSPVADIAKLHFWIVGLINVFDYIKEEGLDYPVFAFA